MQADKPMWLSQLFKDNSRLKKPLAESELMNVTLKLLAVVNL